MTRQVKKVFFNKEEGLDFITVLRKRIHQYFEDRRHSSRATLFTYFKSLSMIASVGIVYSLILSNFFGGMGVLILYSIMGVVAAITTMNIAHDALHGAYASQSVGNRSLGFVMDVLGGVSSFYWKKEHTVDHHTYTNISGHDADLDIPFFLRLCPKAPRYSFHRFQHIYAFFLYSLNLIRWAYHSDVRRIYHIITNQHSKTIRPSGLEIFFLVFFKLVHLGFFVGLPLLVVDVAWWQIIVGYFCSLAITGITMTVIFQLAHIVEDVDFPLPNDEGKIENNFVIHQLTTTSNFATNSKIVSFLLGGLNFQVEHHIFPHVCHTHLSKIAPIVKQTAQEFGLPYFENPSFFTALRSHYRMLKKFGQTPHEVACAQS